MIVRFNLNGATVFIDANPGERLVHILRRRYNLLGSREGCLSGRCGACTVLFNGSPIPSCIVPVFQVQDGTIVTIEVSYIEYTVSSCCCMAKKDNYPGAAKRFKSYRP